MALNPAILPAPVSASPDGGLRARARIAPALAGIGEIQAG
jgi:hypothetical protein